MKNITARKIVLFSIGLLSAIMLLVGLSFSMIDVSLAEEYESASGFKFLAFSFPKDFENVFVSLSQDADYVETYGTLFGITSLLTLIASILVVVLIVLAFFKFDKKKGERLLTIVFICSLVITIAHAIFPIIFKAQMNSDLEKMIKMLEDDYWGYEYEIELLKKMKIGTLAFIPLIFQGVFLTAYIICSKAVKGEKVVSVKVNACKPQEQFEDVLSFELSVIELLKEYKKLHEENIITDAEYMEKRVKIMNSANEKVKRLSGVMSKASFDDVVKAEKTVVQVLREYKKLAESQIISDADYISKKVVLLSCVIN